jgi:hypothetical protein
MKFTVSTLLLVTAFAAIVFGSICAWASFVYRDNEPIWYVLRAIAVTIPLWLPFSFAGFAVGRKKIRAPLLIVLVVAQIAAFGITYAVVTSMRNS